MLSKINLIKILFFSSFLVSSIFCFGDLKELQKEPFKKRIGNYSKYLRTPNPQSLKTLKQARSNSTPNTAIRAKNLKTNQFKRSTLGAMQTLSLDYFRNLHDTFLKNVQIFRFWIQFLKLRPELGLKEFKIRTQHLRNITLQGTETSIQIRQKLIDISKFMKELAAEVQDNSIQFIETSYYAKLLTSQARINFLVDTMGFYIDHLATLQTFQFSNLVSELELLIHSVESINSKHWEKSFESISLKDQAALITKIKNLTKQKLKSFKQIKQNYIYAESQILLDRDQIKTKALPTSRKATRAEVINYRNLQKSFQEKITNFLDRETIQLQILKHKSLQSKKWLSNYPNKNTQPTLPLANQLFKDNQNVDSSIEFNKNNLANESDYSSNRTRENFRKTKKTTQITLPDWI